MLHGNSLYARGAQDTPIILAKSSGRQTGSFASATAPAFDGSTMYTLQSGKLVATDSSGGPDRWTFRTGGLVTAPVVNAGVVFAGASDGTVYGVSARTGARVWTGKAGSVILPPNEYDPVVLTGMAIGGGLLVVPAGHRLTAFSG